MLRGDGITLELTLRVDRVVRYRGGVAVIDFKSVPPHRFELRADRWQLCVYALAIDDVLGSHEAEVRLYLIDVRRGVQVAVPATPAALARARAEVLDCGAAIVAGRFSLGRGHRDRPCWSCGFRLTCPRSLAADPPRPRA